MHQLPAITTKKKWTKKVRPGISTFADHPSSVGPEHLKELFDHALHYIPEQDVPDTPIFLLATAGMRLLSDMQRNEVLKQVCSYAQKTTKFQLPDCDLHIQVIPGETEGLYGWIAANYLLGGFNDPGQHEHGNGHHTYGFLDMGGASAQIAFAPNATEAEKHANDLKRLRLRTLDGNPLEYQLFTATWLGYGVNEARRRYIQGLLDAAGSSKELPDPCLPSGLEVAQSDSHIVQPSRFMPSEPHLLGTGQFTECLSATYPLLDKDATCEDEPCLFAGSHVPAIDFEVNHFVGISEYWHTTHEIFEMGHADAAYDFQTYQSRVTEFCSKSWKDIEHSISLKKYGRKVDEATAAEVCFKASWLINMLHNGIGIPRVGLEAGKHAADAVNGTKELIESAKQQGYLAPFQAINKIDKTEVSWTLGKMVLYASAQVPPARSDVLQVGFGSNTDGGIPVDFQFAGGVAETNPKTGDFSSGFSNPAGPDRVSTAPVKELESPLNDPLGQDTDLEEGADEDWEDRLLSGSTLPHRTPGFLFFLVIVIVAGLLLCGRDRRSNLWRKLAGLFGASGAAAGVLASPSRKGRSLKSKLPSFMGGTPSQGKYERVMEEGGIPTLSGGDFELGALSSNSDEDDGSGGSASSSDRPSRPIARTRSVNHLGGAASPRLSRTTTHSPRTPGLGLAGGSYFEALRNSGSSSTNLSAGGATAETTGSRSRTSSPTRLRTPGGTKESVD